MSSFCKGIIGSSLSETKNQLAYRRFPKLSEDFGKRDGPPSSKMPSIGETFFIFIFKF
jgi:hypothetical protein